jgi:hypothetical protein
MAHLATRGILLEEPNEESGLTDLDEVALWLSRPTAANIDPGGFLNAWNFFNDAAKSIGESLHDQDEETEATYDRLFHYGGPAWHTGLRTDDSPDWSPEEVQRLAIVLGQGLKIFRRGLNGRDRAS